MAEHETDVPAMDYEEHHRTYEWFTSSVKYSIFAIAILLILMVMFL